MPPTPARVLARAAVSAVAFASLAVPAAATASVTVDCAADNSVLLTSAETAVAEAKAVRLAANRPLGLLMQVERGAARAEARTARAVIRALRMEARDRDLSEEERAALLASLEEQSDALRHSLRLLESRRALLAEIKAGRTDAKAALKAVRTALVELRAALDACTVVEEPVEEDPVEDEDGRTVAIP